MSAIIQKLQEISKLNITLPISNKSVQINKINLDLQSKLEQFAVNVENELQSSMQYLEFINNHIRKEINGDVEYLDKLFILQQWHNDLKDDTIDQAIEPVEIQDLPLTINGAEFLFKFELPTVVKDLAFLKYILSKKILKTILKHGSGGYYSKSEIDLEIARPLTRTMVKMHRANQDNYYSNKFLLGEKKLKWIRKLTPLEALRLQGFSDKIYYRAKDASLSDAQMYMQAGNSVTVNVVKAILDHLIKHDWFK